MQATNAAGVDAAIAAAGGMEAFQAALGVARRTVFLWKQQGIPAEHAPAIEAATGVSRQALRPDLWPAPVSAMNDPLREGRANLYALLGNLLAAPPEAGLLARLAVLDGDETPIGQALGALGEAARNTHPEAAAREYHDLFVGLGRGELLPFASYYLTGFLHERPLAELRGELERLGIGRAPGVHEPEDHIGFVCETMAGLLRGGAPELAEGFFARHVRPWAPRCFADLVLAAGAVFYRPVGELGRALMDVELAAAEMSA
ncbi:MAG TPA: molecular chaperone TorD family protein [Roseococcus sp.]|nr:molecular chaperone TorD family protein [Roseococcus sp.]